MSREKLLELNFTRVFGVMVFVLALAVSARASDPVLDWVQIMNDTILGLSTPTPLATSPLVTTRQVALVSAAVFDAVNGIDPRYEPLLVKPNAPKPASRRAAAIEAAYTVLANLYPSQAATLAAHRHTSLMALAGESAKSIQNGIDWGDTVANAILQIRATDGFNPPAPPFEGDLAISQPDLVSGMNPGINLKPTAAIGIWRPTPTGATGGKASGAGPQFASMTPWVLIRPSQFRLLPPYATAATASTQTDANAIATQEYADDYAELKTMGVLTGSGRTADQSQLALFWAGNTALFWNRIARDLSMHHKPRPLTLTENARLFALMNVAMADAGIACWDGKYRYVFWRPITAIRHGGGGPHNDLVGDPAWQPFLDSHPIAAYRGTPAHPEYPSGHSSASGAAAFILAAAFGEDTLFTVTSEATPGVTRSFKSFTQATDEIADARVFAGIHYRSSCVRGNALGRAVAEYVSTHAFGHRDRDEDGDDQ